MVIIALVANGCTWLRPARRIPSEKSRSIHTGKVLNEKRYAQGGRILVTPFSAGSSVEASARLDAVAVHIVSGLFACMRESRSAFSMITAPDAKTADFILRGHILACGHASRGIRSLFRRRPLVLRVEGELVDVRTGEPVVIFDITREDVTKNITREDLGQMMGFDIGRFIATGEL